MKSLKAAKITEVEVDFSLVWEPDHPSCSDPHLNVNVSPTCQVLIHNSDLKRGAYISSFRSLGPDSWHLLCKGPLRAATAPQRPSVLSSHLQTGFQPV